MTPPWIIRSFRPPAWDLVPLTALQWERRGYLVRIAQDRSHWSETVSALVVLAVRPRWRWWLELVRWTHTRCWLVGHRLVLRSCFRRANGARRYLWRCHRCGVAEITRSPERRRRHVSV